MERRLSAIMAADVVGYSRLIGMDETGTLAALRSVKKELVDPALKRHRGRIVKLMGDGLLAEFPSVVDAVAAAVKIQEGAVEFSSQFPDDRKILLRIGVNLGDVVVEDGDIFGDGVNIAARLQEISEPGGVAVSASVHRELRGKLDLSFKDTGEQGLKNIAEPVRTWTWLPGQRTSRNDIAAPALSVVHRPSIAVLPFKNSSNDPDQEFLADGMTEDVISGLSKFHSLFVISSRSSFVFKGTPDNVRDIGNELEVRYVHEGSIRRVGSRIRVTGELIDVETGNYLWSGKFDRSLEDIFAVQDEVAEAIVRAIAPEIGQAEIVRAQRLPPDSLNAWALYQRGLGLYPSGVKEDFQTGIELFDKAVSLDPTFVDAKAMGALLRLRFVFYFRPDNTDVLIKQAQELLQDAMRLDPRNAICYSGMGRLYNILGQPEAAVEACREAIALNSNSVLAHMELASALSGKHLWVEGIEHFDAARKLSPRDPHVSATYAGRAIYLFNLGRYEECVGSAMTVSRGPNPRYWCDAALVAALTMLGRDTEAQLAKKTLLERKPDFSISAYTQFTSRVNTETMKEALRKAGLPG
ncbi:MAG: adenylate/guanylate cyclase domain-containing protein [Hyphomicrobiaceae bacterium]